MSDEPRARHAPFDEKTLDRARILRHDATFPERLLWSKLRARRLGGIKFRRQVPIGDVIVDFYCDDAKFAIELDGDSHIERGKYDQGRTKELTRLHIRVMRVLNDDVLKDLDAVLAGILREISAT
jgi:very-short-patch-repair endonuclease